MIQYEKYKLVCYIMKKESLSIVVSYINVAVNQTDTLNKIYNTQIIILIICAKH